MLASGALSGTTVVDLSRLLPGPYCSMILADHDARVIAIEDRRFLADGLFIDLVNRNKEHMTLNLKTDEGREIFFRLVRSADVVLEGFRPGVVQRLGVDYESVCRANPRIIYCSISGYGQNGSHRDRVGHDVNYLSKAGVLSLVGEADRPPSIPGVQIADIAGAMNAAMGILLALHARQKNGKGQHIDISLTDAVVGFLSLSLFFSQRDGREPRRADELLSHRFACYNTYETADGQYLSIGALENRFWRTLCEALSVPEYAELQYDQQRRLEIIDFMRNAFRSKTMEEWEAILGDLDVCWAKIQSLSEVLEDPLFIERRTIVDIKGTDGKSSKTLGVPIVLDETPGSVRTPPPEFGGSTRAILKELGYTAGDTQRLSLEKVI